MSMDAILGLSLMLVAAAGLGLDLCFQPYKGRIITSAKFITVCIYFLGTLLFAPTMIAAYLPVFGYPIVTMIIYGVATVIFGLLATVFASVLWFEFFMHFNKFMKWYRKILISSP